MKRTKKGQTGIEFLIYMGIIFLVFSIMFVFSLDRKKDVSKIGELMDSKAECLKISNLITGAYVNGNGTQIKTSTDYLMIIYEDNNIEIINPDTGIIEDSCTFYGKSNNYQTINSFMIKNEGGIVTYENVTL